MSKPKTNRKKITDNMWGQDITDFYRWLEKENKETDAWVTSQNRYVEENINFKNEKNEFLKELKDLGSFKEYANPVKTQNGYLFRERPNGQNYYILYWKETLDSDPVEIINPNILGDNVSLDFWEQSKTGKYIAYGLSKGGTEMATLYIKDVLNNKDLEEKIENCNYSEISWVYDDSGFYYSRNPRAGEVDENDAYLYSKIYFHNLGSNPDTDELIFGEGRPKDDMFMLDLSPDDRYLSIEVSQNWNRNDVFIYDTQEKKLTDLITEKDSNFYVYFLHNKILVLTNYKAENFRVLQSDFDNMFKEIDVWEEIVSEGSDIIDTITITKSKVILKYIHDISSKVKVFDHHFKFIEEVPIPEFSNVWGISGDIYFDEYFYNFESFVSPLTIKRYDPKTKKHSIYKQTEASIKPEDYIIRQDWYFSKDKTKIPMFIIHKKDVDYDSKNPTVLYGYGGFGSSEHPRYLFNWIPWLKRGGVFAIANIRGGGEFGEKWHLNGIKDKKQNSFDDFIFAAKNLIEKKITNPKFLSIFGISNGGLLVTAVSVQEPELFNSVVSIVPLTDMSRFHKFGMAIRWTNEYGDPEKEDEFNNIMKWSPYHNIKEDVEYPNYLFTTGENDSRINPFHSRKMVALLQNTNLKNDVYLYTQKDEGHGGNSSVSGRIERQALILNFLFEKYSFMLR